RTVRFWDVAARRELAPITLPTGGGKLAVSADSKTLAVNAGSRGVLWDIATRRERARLPGYWPALAPGGNPPAGGNAGGTTRLWDLGMWQMVGTLRGHAAIAVQRTAHGGGAISGLAFSPDGRLLASAGEDLTVRLWDLATQREIIRPLKGHTDSIWSLAFAP